MRNAFAHQITELAGEHPELVMLSGDIGNRLFNPFKEKYSDRFFNCGAAEANMTSMAAGMALCGLRPITYTITSFNTYRCYEQIRIDLCYQNLPVIVVGVGSGLSYSALNATHHSLEDIAIMRALPNLTICNPADAMELRAVLREAIKHNGPVYIRIGKKNEPVIHKSVPQIKLGQSIKIRDGKDVKILSTGIVLSEVLKAVELLAGKNIAAEVISIPTIKPFDYDLLQNIEDSCKLLVTVEEHGIIGGLGGQVAEHISSFKKSPQLLRIGTQDSFMERTGNQTEAWRSAGLDSESIAANIMRTLGL